MLPGDRPGTPFFGYKGSFLDNLKAATWSSALVGGLVFLEFRFDGEHFAYCWALFAVGPIILGLVSSLALEWKVQRPWNDHARSSLLALLLLALGLMVTKFEGVICLLMAAGFVVPMSLLGAYFGQCLMGIRWAARRKAGLMLSFAVIAPLAMMVDGQISHDPVDRAVSDEVIIDAPASAVWPLLLNLAKIQKPAGQLLLRVGIAHPTEIRTDQLRVGGRRVCALTTGDMVERISIYEPERQLQFEVLNTPPNMAETNPFGDPSPAHLNGWFECQLGEFRLTPLPGGRTRLIGISWYRHRFAPEFYWSLWTDEVVREVHVEVIDEVKRRAEGDRPQSPVRLGAVRCPPSLADDRSGANDMLEAGKSGGKRYIRVNLASWSKFSSQELDKRDALGYHFKSSPHPPWAEVCDQRKLFENCIAVDLRHIEHSKEVSESFLFR